MLRALALIQLSGEAGDGRTLGHFVENRQERIQGLPLFSGCARLSGALRTPSECCRDVCDDVVQLTARVGDDLGSHRANCRLNLRSIKESLSPAHLVVDALFGQSVFEWLALPVHAIENRNVLSLDSRSNLLGNRRCNALGLFGDGVELLHGWRKTEFRLRDQLSALIGAASQSVGEIDDRLSGSVVAGKSNDFRFRETRAKVQQVARGSAGEGVDRLVWIAHNAKIRAIA